MVFYKNNLTSSVYPVSVKIPNISSKEKIDNTKNLLRLNYVFK